MLHSSHNKNTEQTGINFGFIKFANHKTPLHAVRHQRENDGTKSDRHYHDFAQIWYCYGGSYTHVVEKQTYHCEKGSLFVIPPGITHDVLYGEEYVDILVVDIHWDMLLDFPPDKWINAVTNLYWPVFANEIDHSFSCRYILSEASIKTAEECLDWFDLLKFIPSGSVRPEEIYEKAEALFSLPEFTIPESEHLKAIQIAQSQLLPIMRIISHLNNHYPDKINEEDLFREAGISRRGMYRYFKNLIGCTYLEYLRSLRFRHVYIYLRTSTYSLTYIAEACGYCDERYMSRVFKARVGESPQNRRKRLEEYYRQKRLKNSPK